MSSPREPGTARLPGLIAVVFGGAMHLVVAGFVIAAGQLLPATLALGLGVLWVAAATLLWRWRHRRPLVVLLLPFLVALAWWLAVRSVT